MHMQHDCMAGDAVHRAVDEEGGRFDAMAAGQHLAAHVDQHDVVGADLAPVQAARVDQIAVLRARQRDAEMVAHAFGQAVVRGGAQRHCKVVAQRADGGTVVVGAGGGHGNGLGHVDEPVQNRWERCVSAGDR